MSKGARILSILFLCPSWTFSFAPAPGNQQAVSPLFSHTTTTADKSSIRAPHSKAPITAEVVGAAGRIGSLFLTPTAKAVPKGIAPGCWSPPNSPIYVTTPARAWPQILRDTLPHRQQDLVWIGNGIPPLITNQRNETTTIVVPHFGVLQAHADPITSEGSPPTFLYGKHAASVETILRDQGIDISQIRRLNTKREILVAAARKLLWAASMWLLCHDDDTAVMMSHPITALQVHETTKKANALEKLIREELVPALNEKLGSDVNADAALNYMEQYSQSMPTAVPSLKLAKAEWRERSGFFLNVRDRVPQPFHEELLLRVGGISASDIENTNKNQQLARVKAEIPSLGLTVCGIHSTTINEPSAKNAIVIGGGILGSSVALHLAREGCQVTVVDAQQSGKDHHLGETTPASWAWLNANGKSPPDYAWLNQLGMEGWKRDSILERLPSWCGSLVRFRSQFLKTGGYCCEGPLGTDRLKELEPSVNFHTEDKDDTTGDDVVYFYPEEGFVDPLGSVQVMREEAARLGVEFWMGHNVTGFIKNEDGCISGVIATDNEGKAVNLTADTVVLAAGVGSADLGKIPLLYRPGQIAFARPSSKNVQLRRILVDTVRESHVLQRQDGNLVIGGGALEVGGDGAAALATDGSSNVDFSGSENPLLKMAQKLVPGAIGDLSRTEKAVRLIPLDGLPAIGYILPGLYCVVSHSGVTLAPILGALAATELTKGIHIETLETFRPARFFGLT